MEVGPGVDTDPAEEPLPRKASGLPIVNDLEVVPGPRRPSQWAALEPPPAPLQANTPSRRYTEGICRLVEDRLAGSRPRGELDPRVDANGAGEVEVRIDIDDDSATGSEHDAVARLAGGAQAPRR